MTISSIVMFGIFSAMLLIFSCIILQAPELYPEFELKRSSYTHSELILKDKLVLRNRY